MPGSTIGKHSLFDRPIFLLPATARLLALMSMPQNKVPSTTLDRLLIAASSVRIWLWLPSLSAVTGSLFSPTIQSGWLRRQSGQGQGGDFLPQKVSNLEGR
jgi:hypothetical protein